MMTERLMTSKYWALAFISITLGALGLAAVQSTESLAFGAKKANAPQASATPSAAPAGTLIWVTRKDGATSCGTTQAQSLEEGASELQRNGVKVVSSRKGNDGKMHAQACGMPTGSLNAYQISREDLPKALVLGFQEDGHI
ncbi:MAG: hypothetical protein ACJ763_06215 [Bdellovibrionia bacterium]